MYVQCNTAEPSCNHCCWCKALRIT